MNPKETPSEPERNPDKNHMKVYIAKYLRGVAYVLRVDFVGVICFSFLSFCSFFSFLLPLSNCELQISVGISVGPATRSQWAVPGTNCELQISRRGTPGGSGVDLGPVPHDMFSKNA